MLGVNDGYEDDLFFANRAARVKLSSTIKPNKDLTIGAHIELGFKDNAADLVSQNDHTPQGGITQRKIEIYLKTKKFGQAWFGKGDTASKKTVRQDLSGTDDIAYSAVEKFGGGLYFRSTTTKDYSNNPQVKDVFNNLDGFGRDFRLMYITPKFYDFSLAADIITNKNKDASITFNKKFQYVEIAAAAAYTSKLYENDAHGHITNGSFSALLNNGLNLTLASAVLNADSSGRKNPNYYYLKLGYRHHLNRLGETLFSVDYGKYKNYAQNNDKGTTYAADVIQNIDAWNLGLYVGYRKFTLSRVGAQFKDINTVMAGVQFKF